jgi:membrane protein implicated in regulation of membrane protease activity
MNNSTFLDSFQDTHLISWSILPYTNLMGEYFFMLFAFVTFIGIYIKTDKAAPLIVSGSIASAALAYLIPTELQPVLALFISMVFVTVVYRLVKSDRDDD